MSIRIDGGFVVGWSGQSHELIPSGSVLLEGNSIKSVNTDMSICTCTPSSTSATIYSRT
jgi:hypothetical protein